MVVQLPGVKDPQRALDLIGKTAQLEFKLVDSDTKMDLRTLVDEAVNGGRLKKDFSHADLNQVLADRLPPEREIYIRKEVDRETGRVSQAAGAAVQQGPDDRGGH